MTRPRMTTISFMNKKGGAGKTTSLVCTAKVLADLGHDVLVVDLDQQGNAGCDVFNIDTEDEYTSLEVIKGECKASDAIRRSWTLPVLAEDPDGNPVLDDAGNPIVKEPSVDRGVDVLASDEAMSDLAFSGAALPGVQMRLKAALDEVRGDYDFCLIDCPPSLGYETTIALTASDFVVIPTEADFFSAKGFMQMNDVIGDVRKWYNPDIEILGILVTQFDSRTKFSKALASELEDYSKKLGTFVYYTRIRSTIRVKEAHDNGLTVIEYAPNSTTAQDYRAFASELLDALAQKGR